MITLGHHIPPSLKGVSVFTDLEVQTQPKLVFCRLCGYYGRAFTLFFNLRNGILTITEMTRFFRRFVCTAPAVDTGAGFKKLG